LASHKSIKTKVKDPRNVFIAHGRNQRIHDEIFDYLKALELSPKDFSSLVATTGEGTPDVGKVLTKAFKEAQAVIILLTPDDVGCLRRSFQTDNDPITEKQLTPQARLNVIFEAGIAMGRCPRRTIIVQVGNIRPFSNIAGRQVVMLDNSEEKKTDLAKRLLYAGCPVDPFNQKKWVNVGNFDLISPAKNYVVNTPLENYYSSIKRWLNEIQKARGSRQNNSETVYKINASMQAYCDFAKQTPDDIIADAKEQWEVFHNVDRHNELVEDFVRELSEKEGDFTTKVWNYSNNVRAFYKHSGISITTTRVKRPILRKIRSISTEELQSMIKVAPIKHQSWILVSNYLGLGVRQIVKLTCDDFNVTEWKKEKPFYPVNIREEVSGTYSYTGYIGADAKNVLAEYFALNGFFGQRNPWDFCFITLSVAFKRYAHRAKVIGAPNGSKDGVPYSLSEVTPLSLQYRLFTKLQEANVPTSWISELMGHEAGIIANSRPTKEQLEKAFGNALPKLRVFENVSSIIPVKLTDFENKMEADKP
jgi:predicted nucleotide-binding protein